MKISGIKIFEEVGRIPEEFILESENFCGEFSQIPERRKSKRPAWLTDGVIAAAVCVLIGIVTYVGILTFMSGGFDHLAAGLFGKDDTTAETTLDETEDVTSDYAEDITTFDGEEAEEHTTQIDVVEHTVEISYDTININVIYPEDVETMAYTEEELNSYSSKILNPTNGQTLRMQFGVYELPNMQYPGKSMQHFGKSKFSGTDSFLGWITCGESGKLFDKSIPVTVEFEEGIVNKKTYSIPEGYVVLSEKGVEFIDGRIIYHAKDIIYDATVNPYKIENGVVYGTMLDYLKDEEIPVQFMLPDKIELPSDFCLLPENYTPINDKVNINPVYYFAIKNMSLVGLKNIPNKDGICDLSEIVTESIELLIAYLF